MKQLGTALAVFSVIIFSGGLMGFYMANSIPSLVASGIFGTLLLFSALMTLQGKRWGYFLGLATTFVLAIFFTGRYFQQGTTVPMVMAIVSFVFGTGMLCKGLSLCKEGKAACK